MDQEERAAKRSPRNRQIPDGWLDCPSFGRCITDLIIPSKVPLDYSYKDVPTGKIYSPNELITEQKAAGHEIGLVVDLTNTYRYYSVQEWTNFGIQYIKIACKGQDAVPDNEAVNQFVYTVLEFVDSQKKSTDRKYIIVHCTHGFNRTGFMIIHYLMRTQISSVSKSRPDGIYKLEYIKALYDFYHEVHKNLVCHTPKWKLSPGHAEDCGSASSSTHSYENEESRIITNDDILSDAIPSNQERILRNLCCRMLQLPNVWKYPEMNSVDFLFEIDRKNEWLLFLHHKGKTMLMPDRIIFREDMKNISAISGKIVECFWHPRIKCWVFMRIRHDKQTPNEFSTYEKVKKSIGDNITERDLLDYIKESVTQSEIYQDNASAQALLYS